ncbi:MAG TPA: PEP/pyruvate-binding domain-containing protein [Pseudonocardiaceae bacterium]|nr:PEP/pyruvate-binding domain-containing protein [Pseudonocardiaceae bacterium]
MSSAWPLRGVTLADTGRVGRKAAALGELLAAGFPVPDGFVLPTDTEDVAGALAAITAAMGAQALAVRSSGVDEDLAGASYAGQYTTVLDVRGSAALLAAVRACRASAGSEQVSAYRRARGLGGGPPMAVLVQRMVPAQAAGVAFSANPVTGDRAETMVSAVRGLGDRLAAGQVTPDEWVVRGGVPTRRSGRADAITAEQARAVAELAGRVAAHLGAPQDIEWALAGGQLWLLQARPITALPVLAAVPVEVPPGFWQRDGYCPRPWSPMHRSLALPALQAALTHLFAYGVADGLEFAEIGGWMYTRVVAPDTPEQVQARIQQIVAAVRADEPGQTVRRWHEEWAPALTARVAQHRDVDLTSLTDTGLAEHLQAVQALVEHIQDAHCRVGAAGAFLLGELGVAARDLLHWDVRRVLQLLTGLPGKTTEPAFALADLAQRARATSGVARLLERVGADTALLLAGVDAGFARAFAGYQREYGHRAMSPDLIDPTLAERPTLMLSLIRDQMVRPLTPAAHVAALQQERSAAVAEAQAKLAARPAAHRDRFERALARAQQAYPVREDSMFHWSAARALLRYAVLELGRRLTDRGQLARAPDVFFLTSDEAAAALRDRTGRRDVVAHRAAERAWAQAHPGPASYGMPSYGRAALVAGAGGAALPPEARHALDVAGWAWAATGEHPGRPGTDQPGLDRPAGLALRGVAACAGRYTGPACVITDETGFGKLRPGDVLICPETTAAWSILFPSVGALVTDTGGLLSHPAIIAREYRVPAVLATGNATKLLRDGQIVTVDGCTGEVRVETGAQDGSVTRARK